MDTVTHALLGALAACAVAPRRAAAPATLAPRERLALGAAAGAFPDVDFAAFALDPLRFLADWHQGPTHSLVLLPLWAAAIAAVAVRWRGRRPAFGDAWRVCAAALATHALADAATAYGTMLAYPLSTQRLGTGTVFVVDPWYSAITLAGTVAVWARPRRATALAALAAVGVYVGALALAQQQALAAGAASAQRAGIALASLHAYAQPLSPLHWRLVGTASAQDPAGPVRHVADLDLAGTPTRIPRWPALRPLHDLAAAYRPAQALAWQRRALYGDASPALARQRWADPRFEPFRRFAAHPALARLDGDGTGAACVWFTDLRYDLPTLPATFRFGFCRAGAGDPWALYRLRYFATDARQRLGS